MKYASLTVLIPGHSLEDFPFELPEQQAEGLLNAFSVLWHPVLLAAAGCLPDWHRADEPPGDIQGRLIIVPTACTDWLPCTWLDDIRNEGAHVISGITQRQSLVDAALAPLLRENHADQSNSDHVDASPSAEHPQVELVDPDLVADFLALGHCHLQLELLTRQMRYYPDHDNVRFDAAALAAARAALASDRTATQSHLRTCFEMLLEGRERFYPVDCYLLDLCLLSADQADVNWQTLVNSGWPVSFLASASDWEQIAAAHLGETSTLGERWSQGGAEILGGEWDDTCTSLRSLECLLWQFRRGRETLQRLLGRVPVTWARRRFGVGPHLPQILDKLGYRAALHFVMDDGLYPDEELGKLRWEGCDGSVIDATSRIPLAADSAASFLRFAQRMSETMDYDHTAIVVLARWPKLLTPWLEDFHRMQKYAPVLGKFVTFAEFFEGTETPGRRSTFPASDYLSPHLVRSVARGEADPISRYVNDWSRQFRYESAAWQRALAGLLQTGQIERESVKSADDQIVPAGPDADPAIQSEADSWLVDFSQRAPQMFSRTVLGEAGRSKGSLLVNTQSYPRRTVVEFTPEQDSLQPVADAAVFASQWDSRTRSLVVDLPPCGFVWLPARADDAAGSPPLEHDVPLAEDLTLRNEFFEVRLSDITGGIGQIRTYRRSPNRLSQQLAFRFPRERTVTYGEGDKAEQVRSCYSEMRMDQWQVLSDGPALGEIETVGQIIDQQNETSLAEYRQRVRVWRGRPVIEIDIDVEIHRQLEGDPWSSYFAARFAWHDPEAALTASMFESAHPVSAHGERMEAPLFIEIASDEQRATLFPLGLPFHRKTGPRMLDTLLIVAGESRRRFRLAISIDEEFPMQRARDLMAPVEVAESVLGPATATSGWLFHLDARNVQLTRLLPAPLATSELLPVGVTAFTPQFMVRLRETEGRQRTVRLQCYRTPVKARQVDLRGETLTDLVIDGDAIVVDVRACEICDVAIQF